MYISPYDRNFETQSISGINTGTTNTENQQMGNNPPPPPPQDGLSVSGEGMRMSDMMSKAKGMDSTEMEEKMASMKTTMDELDLENLDTSSMTREELESKMTEINSAMESMKPEGAPTNEMDLEELTDEELTSMIDGFAAKAENVKLGMEGLQEMSETGMPPMGRPQGPPPGDKMQNAYGMTSATEDTEESTTTDLMESILEALETDESDEASTLSQMILDYLEE